MSFKVESDIKNERDRQTQLWGPEEALVNHLGIDKYLHKKMVVMMEEVGEACKEINDKNLENLYAESVQVAAVAKAICEGINHYMENHNVIQS